MTKVHIVFKTKISVQYLKIEHYGSKFKNVHILRSKLEKKLAFMSKHLF